MSVVKHRLWLSLLLSLVLLAVVVFLLIPFIWMFSIALRNPADAYKLPPSIFPDSFDLSSFYKLFSSKINLPVLYRNSIISTVFIVAAQFFTCPLAGYAFARLRFKGKKVLFYLLLISLMIPIQVVSIPLYFVMSKLELLNTLASIVLPFCFSAFGVFLFRQSFYSVPPDFEDAAKIDGAGYFFTYWKILLPQIKATVITFLVLTFCGSWNLYYAPLLFLTRMEKMTLPIGITFLKGYMGTGNVSIIMAAVTLAVLPVMIAFLLAQRFIVEGVVSSGIKG